ncbi:MAG: hypothetical protein ACJ746_18310 [Bryobacteraceae bacterium]
MRRTLWQCTGFNSVPEVIRAFPQSLGKEFHLLMKLLDRDALDRYLTRREENGVTQLILEQRPLHRHRRGAGPVTTLAIVPFRCMPSSLSAVIAAVIFAVFSFAITAGEIAVMV